MNEELFSRLISYLEEILATKSNKQAAEALERLEDHPKIEAVFGADLSSSDWVHKSALQPYFERLDADGERMIADWARNKTLALHVEHTQREKVKKETSNLLGKRIVVFFDGTSNTPEELRHITKNAPYDPPAVTNVIRLMRGVQTDVSVTDKPQIIGYFRGVANEGSAARRLADSITGRGFSRLVLDAYRFISHNLEWSNAESAKVGQSEIYIFGFSRGAFAARALAGFLNRRGLVKKSELWQLPAIFDQYQKFLATGEGGKFPDPMRWKEALQPEFVSIPVHFIGVWDTVGALGIPVSGLSWINTRYKRFYDCSLTSDISHAYQALAIHELRRPFKPVFWTAKAKPSQKIEQVWFAGAHADVGGGYENTGLSTFALDWLAYKAQVVGLELDPDYFKKELKDCDAMQRIASSRKIGHGEPGLWNNVTKFPGRFERPFKLADINRYLSKYFRGQTMTCDVYDGMKIHWSAENRLKSPVFYRHDIKSLENLDKNCGNLPVVPRHETLT